MRKERVERRKVMPPKPKKKIHLKLYPIIERAVEEGVTSGWRRAHDHYEPEQRAQEDLAIEIIVRDVLSVLDEVINWNID